MVVIDRDKQFRGCEQAGVKDVEMSYYQVPYSFQRSENRKMHTIIRVIMEI